MRKHIKSSWNSDRVAGSVLNKEHKAHAVKSALRQAHCEGHCSAAVLRQGGMTN